MGRSASSPSAGIISPCARYQSPPQPKLLNSKRKLRCAAGHRFQHGLARRHHFLADAVAGNAGDAIALHVVSPMGMNLGRNLPLALSKAGR